MVSKRIGQVIGHNIGNGCWGIGRGQNKKRSVYKMKKSYPHATICPIDFPIKMGYNDKVLKNNFISYELDTAL